MSRREARAMTTRRAIEANETRQQTPGTLWRPGMVRAGWLNPAWTPSDVIPEDRRDDD
jgi:hypothetical protein